MNRTVIKLDHPTGEVEIIIRSPSAAVALYMRGKVLDLFNNPKPKPPEQKSAFEQMFGNGMFG